MEQFGCLELVTSDLSPPKRGVEIASYCNCWLRVSVSFIAIHPRFLPEEMAIFFLRNAWCTMKCSHDFIRDNIVSKVVGGNTLMAKKMATAHQLESPYNAATHPATIHGAGRPFRAIRMSETLQRRMERWRRPRRVERKLWEPKSPEL